MHTLIGVAFPCPQCNQGFTTYSSLRWHRESVHVMVVDLRNPETGVVVRVERTNGFFPCPCGSQELQSRNFERRHLRCFFPDPSSDEIPADEEVEGIPVNVPNIDVVPQQRTKNNFEVII